jgi:hypothetical protein
MFAFVSVVLGVGLIHKEVPAGGESVIRIGLLAITGNDRVGRIGFNGCEALLLMSFGVLVLGDVLCCAIAIPTGIEAEDVFCDMRGFLGNCLVAVLVCGNLCPFVELRQMGAAFSIFTDCFCIGIGFALELLAAIFGTGFVRQVITLWVLGCVRFWTVLVTGIILDVNFSDGEFERKSFGSQLALKRDVCDCFVISDDSFASFTDNGFIFCWPLI